ncbi:MAG TPA: rhomboid family intramembrane serine protease, partial [Phycisphaerae bacterium]|nr:rhomboid family intramembrane serine protease [Phycisphaerae bacterium]
IFGNNIEDRLGHVLFIIFYLAGGVCGNLLHAFFSPGYIPLVGASGAVSAVMGGYLLLFPHARIFAIVPIGWYPATFSLPAWIYMGFYIVLQNFVPAFSGSESNVAYWAHIGGFVSGMAMMVVLPKRKAAAPPPVYDPRHDDADFVL